MELLLPQLEDRYFSLDNIMQAINFFASLQGYTIMKKHTKTSKKGIVYKVVLMYNYNKVYITEYWYKRDTSTCKTDYLFDAIVIIQNGE